MTRMSNSIPDLPLYLLHLCSAEGVALEYRPDALRELVVNSAEANPVIRGMHMLEGHYGLEARTCLLSRDLAGNWTLASEDEPETSKLTLGEVPAGSLIGIQINPNHLPHGHSAAPAVSSALAFAEGLWQVGIPALTPALDVERDSVESR